TAVIFLGIFIWGARQYVFAETPPRAAEVIHVVARQWMWDIHQPNGRREFDTLHVPAGVPIRLVMTSNDVIHDLFVPAFRLKQDIVPGKQVGLWFTATKPGRYLLECAQYCGAQHSRMVGTVVVQSAGAYARWLEQGPPPQQTIATGRRLFVQYGCSGCHAPGSGVNAPRLNGLYGREAPQAGGGFRRVDDAYLRDCILEPEKVWPAGYPHIMPSFKGVVSEGDLLQILAYIRSMGKGGTVAETRNLP
ncbi:MAG: cytochrome c oxidase subunit II, partial [Chloroflexota bacterium]